MNLSEHFSYRELVRSDYATRHGIKNEPNVDQLAALEFLCKSLLEPIRELIAGKPIQVLSGFRNVSVNNGVGGSSTSQHMTGQAADIEADGLTTEELFQIIKISDLKFDQLIQEFGEWVHVSIVPYNNRGQAIRATRRGTETHYENVV